MNYLCLPLVPHQYGPAYFVLPSEVHTALVSVSKKTKSDRQSKLSEKETIRGNCGKKC